MKTFSELRDLFGPSGFAAFLSIDFNILLKLFLIVIIGFIIIYKIRGKNHTARYLADIELKKTKDNNRTMLKIARLNETSSAPQDMYPASHHETRGY